MYRALKLCLIVSVLIITTSNGVFATTIKGKVLDASSREQLIGATVVIKELNKGTTTNLDGSYSFHNIAPGNYTLRCNYVGYESVENAIVVSGDIVTSDFLLNLKKTGLKEVVIKGATENESTESARKSELNADNVINVMPAKTIDLSPDINVAAVLQRVAGVSVEGNGNRVGQYAIIRGMDKRYNYTEVNGVKIPSPDNKNRYVPMDIFPSELLQKLDVIKSLLPSMEADAIGGAMNVVMKDAPSTLTVRANIAGGFSQILADRGYSWFNTSDINLKSPAEVHGSSYLATPADFPISNLKYSDIKLPINSVANFSIGNRFFKNKLGVIFAGSFHNTFSGMNTHAATPNSQPAPDNTPVMSDFFIRQYSSQQISEGLHLKLDYNISPLHKIELYTLYLNLTERETRYSVDSVLAIQRTGPGSGNVDITNRSLYRIQSIYNTTLKGTHILTEHLKLNWTGAYSIAKSQLPDWAEYKVAHSVGFDSAHHQYATPGIVDAMTRRWVRNTDKDLAGYLNLIYNAKLWDRNIEVMAGGMYRHKQRDNYYNEYSLQPLGKGNNTQTFKSIDSAKYSFQSNAGLGTPVNPNTYTVTEDVWAYFIQAKMITLPKLQLLVGVRSEGTSDDYTTPLDPLKVAGAKGTISYIDVLPGAHLKYILNKKQNLRLSYYQAITRPGFFEIIPYQIPGEFYDERGNPYLKHTTSDNFDARYEFFPSGINQFMAGAFYKKIYDPIEYIFVRTGVSSVVLQPQNIATATNYGFELVATQYFKNFGVNANYTYTSSNITTAKDYYYRDALGNLTHKSVDQTRPLQGQSKHIGNISLLYKNAKAGFDAQISAVYTGRRITYLSSYLDLDYWQRATTVLSFSAEKTLGKHLSIYCKLNNLLNTPIIYEIMQPNAFRSGVNALPDQDRNNRINVEKDFTGQSYLLGIKLNLNYNKNQ